MHDKNGTPLKVGDKVLIEAEVTQLSEGTQDYCNVTVQTVHGRRPDGQKETWSAVNTGVMVKFCLAFMLLGLAFATPAQAGGIIGVQAFGGCGVPVVSSAVVVQRQVFVQPRVSAVAVGGFGGASAVAVGGGFGRSVAISRVRPGLFGGTVAVSRVRTR